MKDSAQYLKLWLQYCSHSGRFGRYSNSTFAKLPAQKIRDNIALPTSNVKDIGVGPRRSGRCKERVYPTVVVEILATMVTVMVNSTSLSVVFVAVGIPTVLPA